MKRRLFLKIAGLVLPVALSLIGQSLLGQNPRFLVLQNQGLYNIRDASTGGRLVWSPTSERMHVPGRGEQRVVGHTDRAARREIVVTRIDGSGSAWVSVTYRPEGTNSTRTIFQGWLTLPAVVPQTVSANATFDNITVTVHQNGRVSSKRLPIGSRP
jgi:hypothetical protein